MRDGLPRGSRPNPEMMGVFWMREPRTLYGRRTEVIRHGSKVGDIVEVLPHGVSAECDAQQTAL